MRKRRPIPASQKGFILDKSIGVNCPKRIENARILIANTCGCSRPILGVVAGWRRGKLGG
jgi:hypothetical protein